VGKRIPKSKANNKAQHKADAWIFLDALKINGA